jgi:hypothetical protein
MGDFHRSLIWLANPPSCSMFPGPLEGFLSKQEVLLKQLRHFLYNVVTWLLAVSSVNSATVLTVYGKRFLWTMHGVQNLTHGGTVSFTLLGSMVSGYLRYRAEKSVQLSNNATHADKQWLTCKTWETIREAGCTSVLGHHRSLLCGTQGEVGIREVWVRQHFL